MLPVLAGAIAGTLHVFAGPDHLAAVAPLAVRSPKRAVRTGAAWGLGHGAGVMILGAIGVVARSLVDVQALSEWAEFLVGAVLVGVGLWALRQSRALVIHAHDHPHEDHKVKRHEHVHVHMGKHEHKESDHAHHTHAAFGVGMLHGAAGTGHLFGVLPSLALPPAQAAMYLVAYAVAAVLSMAGFGLGLGYLGRQLSPAWLRGLMVATGMFAVALGGFWMVSGWPLHTL